MPGIDHNEIECLQSLSAVLPQQQLIDVRDTLQLAVDEPDPLKKMSHTTMVVIYVMMYWANSSWTAPL